MPHFVFCENGSDVKDAIAKDTDMLEVYYAQAPVFEAVFHNLFGYLHGYHCAFGVVNKHSGAEWTLEYDAYSEVLNSTLPIIGHNADGSIKLEWYNRGHNCLAAGFNRSYYHTEQQLVTTITGSQWNKMLEWTVKDNSTWPEYELWYVYDRWNGVENSTRWMNSSTCYDYNWRGFQFLYDVGAKLNYSQVYKHDYINLYSDKPQKVDYNDPLTRWKVNKFFSSWHLHFNDTAAEILEFLETILIGDKYIYAYGDYWLLPKMHHPYVGNVYTYQPLPGTPPEIERMHRAANPDQVRVSPLMKQLANRMNQKYNK